MEHALIFLEIVVINLLLSGDNAIVIAMASKQLPAAQQKLALRLGAIIAICLRCILAVIAVSLLQVPYLQAAGALLLFYIALKLLGDIHKEEKTSVQHARSLPAVLKTIIIADLVMSLDNVVAIAAIAQGDYILVFCGIALSIPLIIWGSNFLSKLLQRFSWIAYIGAALLAYTAGKMFVGDIAIAGSGWVYEYSLQSLIPLISVPLLIVIAILKKRVA